MQKMKYAIKVFFASKIYSGASTLLYETSHFPSDPSRNQRSVRALWALMGVNGPDQPHPWTRSTVAAQLWEISLQLCHSPALPGHGPCRARY